MKVLVTGGAGFIGSHFVEWTINNRPEVELIVLDKLTYASVVGKDTVQSLGVPLMIGDIANPTDVAKASSGVDVIVNFAAETHNDNSIDGPDIFFQTNVLGTLELVKYAAAHDIRFHQISTDEVFGDLPLDSSEKFTEDSPYRPSSPYSASKAAADHIVRAWVRTYGLKGTISNCSNNYGPRQHPEKLIPRTIELLVRGERPVLYGSGENIRDWIHVEDHVRGVWLAIERGEIGGTYLFGANLERSNLDLVREICEILGVSSDEMVFTPDRPGHDRRYAIESLASQRKLGWIATRKNMRAELVELLREPAKMLLEGKKLSN
jgi:dTDP-glucose 4,6-dehydratase